jgi:urease accessory protein
MRHDSELMRPNKPFVFTNTLTGEGIDKLVDMIFKMALFDKINLM